MSNPHCHMCKQPIVNAKRAILGWWVDDKMRVVECGAYCLGDGADYRCAWAADSRPGLFLYDSVPGDFSWGLVARIADTDWDSAALVSLIRTTEAMMALKNEGNGR